MASSAIAHRIRRDGQPLLTSVAFGEHEFIAADGVRTSLKPGPVEVVKRGPFNVTLKMGALVASFPLDDEAEPAPVFEA